MKREEQHTQEAIVAAWRIYYPRDVIFHIPNGGKRTKIEASIFKKMGVLAGVFDLFCMWQGGCGFLEVKSDNGAPSEAQLDFMEACERCGIQFAFVRNLDEALTVWKKWMAT